MIDCCIRHPKGGATMVTAAMVTRHSRGIPEGLPRHSRGSRFLPISPEAFPISPEAFPIPEVIPRSSRGHPEVAKNKKESHFKESQILFD